MTMIHYYDFCKLGLLSQANATSFKLPRQLHTCGHASQGQKFLRAGTCLGETESQQFKGEERGRVQWVDHRDMKEASSPPEEHSHCDVEQFRGKKE